MSEKKIEPHDETDDDGNGDVEQSLVCNEGLLIDDVKKRFEKQCIKLKIPSTLYSTVWTTWKQLSKENDSFQENPYMWLFCLLFISATDARLPYGPKDPNAKNGKLKAFVNLSHILKLTNMRIVDFFKRVKFINGHKVPSSTVKETIRDIERKFCIDSVLFNKFDKIYDEIFEDEGHNSTSTLPGYSLDEFCKKKTCWCLFLIAKNAMFCGCCELVTLFHLLLCCIHYFIKSTPSFRLCDPYDTIQRDYCDNPDPYCLLKELCEKYNSSFDEVKILCTSHWESFVFSMPQQHNSIDYHSHLLCLYHDQYIREGHFDERLFMDKKCQQLRTSKCGLVDDIRESTSAASSSSSSSSSSLGQQEHQDDSAQSESVVSIRAVLNTIHNLKTVLAALYEKPSDKLLTIFDSCSPLLSHSITALINTMEDEFNEAFVEAMVGANASSSSILAHQRFKLAVCLYYRVLEALLIKEQNLYNKSTPSDLTSLLNNKVFHKSLIACSVEVIMVTYGSPAVPLGLVKPACSVYFPWVLNVFHIDTFDLCKIIDRFINAESKLTYGVVRHLQNIEVEILDSLAWKKESPVFKLFEESKVHVIYPDVSQAPAQTEDKNKLFDSTSHTHTTSHNIPQKSTVLKGFLQKVCMLGYKRLQSLCSALPLTKENVVKVWTLFESCLWQKPELLKGRHLDQIMMCCIYAVCKVLEKQMRFKAIVNTYRDTLRSDTDIYKNVLIHGDIHDTIITFYNQIFMHSMKEYILKLVKSQKGITSPVDPVPVCKSDSVSLMSHSPVYSVPGHSNIYVSPLRGSPFKSPPPSSTIVVASPTQSTHSKITPHTKQLFKFGHNLEAGEKIKIINEYMRSASQQNTTPSRGQKRLYFDSQEEDNDEPQSERIVIKKKPPKPPPPLTSGHPKNFNFNS